MIGRIDGWIFASGDARRLAAVRIGLCGALALRLSRPMYVQLGEQPRALFRPISFMHLFRAMPSGPAVVAIQVVAVLACVLAAAGVVTRIALPIGWLAALFLNGMWTSLGQPMHNESLLLLALVPLLFAPASDAWSVPAQVRRRPAPAPSVRYGWPVRTAMIVVAGGYFFSGLYKLVFSGLAWVTTDNLRWVMYGISDENSHPIGPALYLASHPLLAHLAAAITLALELGFPLCLWKPAAARLVVPGIVLLHLGIGLTMHLDYSAWAITVVVLFVPWDAMADRIRDSIRARPAVRPETDRPRSASLA
jgi:hypothetical protein